MTQEQRLTATKRIDLLKGRLATATGEEKINILSELAGSYQELPPGERIAFATQAIALSEELHDQKAKATAYTHLGIAYNNVGNSDRSLDCFFKALQIMEEIDDQDGIAYSYICIGQAYFYLDTFDKALRYFQQALEIREKLGDKQDVSQVLILIGNVKAKTAQYDEAIECYSKALAMKEEAGDERGISQIYNNLANVYLAIGKMDAVLKYRLASLRIARKLGDSWEIALTTFNMAEYYLKVKQPEEALPYIRESQKLAEKLDNKGLTRDNLENMALYHELRGEYDDALKCLREHSKLTEALFAEELAEKISEMQVKYETAQLEDCDGSWLERYALWQPRWKQGTPIPPAINSECRSWPVLLLRAWAFRRNELRGSAWPELFTGLPEERVEGVRLAGVIHDIGKISVPAEILNTPRPLTETEYSLVKMHPKIGHDILAGIDFSAPVADIVLQHHERMDGSGYPTGLKGDEILLEARILAVADVVEAMVSHRPYRPALGIDRALEEISKNKGTKYDPEVVDACLNRRRVRPTTFPFHRFMHPKCRTERPGPTMRIGRLD